MSIESRIADSADGDMREAYLWLPTYAALCILLLAFCVLLYSMSLLDTARAQDRWHGKLTEMQAGAFSDIRAFIAQNGMEADIDALLEDTAITLRLSEEKFFAHGVEQILPEGFNTLNKLKDLFILQDRQTINIRGYTDDAPLPPGTRFRNNWELSSMRAAYILRHLLAQGIEPGRLSAAGFGEREPLFPNTTEKNRAKNRRVEFVLERRIGKE